MSYVLGGLGGRPERPRARSMACAARVREGLRCSGGVLQGCGPFARRECARPLRPSTRRDASAASPPNTKIPSQIATLALVEAVRHVMCRIVTACRLLTVPVHRVPGAATSITNVSRLVRSSPRCRCIRASAAGTSGGKRRRRNRSNRLRSSAVAASLRASALGRAWRH